MKRYRVWFTSYRLVGEKDYMWHSDYLDNNGAGFTADEARRRAEELKASELTRVRSIRFEEMGTENFVSEV